MFAVRVVGLWAGMRWGTGLRGDGGGARDVRARTATGDEDNFCTTPFFFAENTIQYIFYSATNSFALRLKRK